MTVEVRPAERADCHDLAPRMRDVDAVEVRLTMDLEPAGALLASFDVSDLAYTVVINGRVEGMFGVASDCNDADHGIPWLLGSSVLADYPRDFLRVGRRHIQMMAVLYTTLRNAVHHEHTQSFTLLEHLGFVRVNTLGSFGINEDTFYLYLYV